MKWWLANYTSEYHSGNSPQRHPFIPLPSSMQCMFWEQKYSNSIDTASKFQNILAGSNVISGTSISMNFSQRSHTEPVLGTFPHLQDTHSALPEPWTNTPITIIHHSLHPSLWDQIEMNLGSWKPSSASCACAPTWPGSARSCPEATTPTLMQSRVN